MIELDRLKGGTLNLKIGARYGRWTILKLSENKKHGNRLWLCRCECGVEKEVIGSHLNKGRSQSCGCFQRETVSLSSATHKLSRGKTPLYAVWQGIKQRCLNENSYGYQYYGKRGVTISEDWKDFVNFYNDMSPSYKEGLSIERIDVNKGYCKENCKWATKAEQARNRKTTVFIDTVYGKLTITEAAKKAGITNSAMMNRVFSNWSKEDILLPARTKRNAST